MKTPLVSLAVLTATLMGSAALAQESNLQPYASYWFPEQLLQWSPEKDPDAVFNRSSVPLAKRFIDPKTQANPSAKINQARIVSLVAFNSTAQNPSQGSARMRYYSPQYWQYVDQLVFWGGSAGEGLILAPNSTVIDAAHRNGVPVLGTVFLPPTVYGGKIQWLKDLVQEKDGAFPVADKMIEVANFYGFDGWFINQETEGADAALAKQTLKFVQYLKDKSGKQVMWYDSMVENGEIDWQNALTPKNQMYFQASSSMFNNFWWTPEDNQSSHDLAKKLGRSPYDLYTGIDVEANGFVTALDWDALFPPNKDQLTSLGIYRPEWTYNSTRTLEDFYTRDSIFWVGLNGNPANIDTSLAWKGLAYYVPSASSVQQMPFVTSFNVGQGKQYAIDGQVLSQSEWNNLSVQDILPSYRWVMQGTLKPSMDFDTAYNGGNSLKVTGKLDGENVLKLYQTQLKLEKDSQLNVVFKPQKAGASGLGVRLTFTDGSTTTLALGDAKKDGWNSNTVSLTAHAGKTINVVSLVFSGKADAYQMNIGQLGFLKGDVDAPSAPTDLKVLSSMQPDSDTANLRLNWGKASTPVLHYNLYKRNADGSKVFLGATPNNHYYVSGLKRLNVEPSSVLEVEAVSPERGRSAVASTTFAWKDIAGSVSLAKNEFSDKPSPIGKDNLAVGKTATSDSACGAPEGPEKAINGTFDTGGSDKWCSLGKDKWMELDLGAVMELSRFVIKHAGAGGEDPELNTREFALQVRSTPEETWKTVVTVRDNVSNESSHTIPPTEARYVRLVVLKPTNSGDPAARIYELEVYGNNTPINTINYALNRPTKADSACGAPEGPEKAVNGTVNGGNSDKWCSLGKEKWMEVDLGEVKDVSRFVVKHAALGGEPADFNTRDFNIQVKENESDPWKTVATVTDNSTDESKVKILPVKARFVRLNVTAASQSGDPAARIYEFEVY